MQKHMTSGRDELEDGGEDAIARLGKALNDEKVRSVTLHKAGAIVKRSNGRRYQVNALGQWVRLD